MVGSVWDSGTEIAVKFDDEQTWSKMAYELPHDNPYFPYGVTVPHDFNHDCERATTVVTTTTPFVPTSTASTDAGELFIPGPKFQPSIDLTRDYNFLL